MLHALSIKREVKLRSMDIDLVLKFLISFKFLVTFLLAKRFSDLDNPDCLDFRASRNKNLK